MKVIDTRQGLPRESIDRIDPSLKADIKDVFIVIKQDPKSQSLLVYVPLCYSCSRELQIFNKRELDRGMIGMDNLVTYLEFRCRKHWQDFAIALDQVQLSLFNRYPAKNIYYQKMTPELREQFLIQKKAYEATQQAQ